MTRFLYAARSVILVISAQSAVIAGLLAAADRRFAVLPFALVLVGYVGPDGVPLARGLVGYDAVDLPSLLGKRTGDVPAEFGRELVYRDDLVLL